MDAVIGIDPGKAGAISIMYIDGPIEILDMPTIKEGKKGKEQIDFVGLSRIFKNLPVNSTAFVELQHALTRYDPVVQRSVAQGAVSNVSLGKGYGAILMGLAMMGIPYEETTAKQWQKYFRISGDNTKAQAHGIAQRLFPTATFVTPRGRLLDGRCDSILLAEYGRRRLLGGGGQHVENSGGEELPKPRRRAIRPRA